MSNSTSVTSLNHPVPHTSSLITANSSHTNTHVAKSVLCKSGSLKSGSLKFGSLKSGISKSGISKTEDSFSKSDMSKSNSVSSHDFTKSDSDSFKLSKSGISETSSLASSISDSTIDACSPMILQQDTNNIDTLENLETIPTPKTLENLENLEKTFNSVVLDVFPLTAINPSGDHHHPETNSLKNPSSSTLPLTDTSTTKTQKIQKLDGTSNFERRVFKCSICMSKRSEKHYPVLPCGHKTCKGCLRTYLNLEINEGRTKIGCPASKSCNWNFGRAAVARLVGPNPEIMQKWDKFQLQRCLYLMPNMVFCPFPDCDWAVVAPRDCKKCPKIECASCKNCFCYNCRNPWEGNHKSEKCLLKDERRRLLQSISTINNSKNVKTTTNFDGTGSGPRLPDSNEIKPCPQCGALIAKIMDGGCNHIVCSVCHCHFCWLCLKEVTEVHFLSPSGCTFWGNNLWSTRKRVVFQMLGILSSPLIVICLILLSLPAILVALPILTYKYTTAWSKKLSKNMQGNNRQNCFQGTLVWGATILSVLVSPIAAVCGAVIVAPISILYVFCIVPLDLIRNRTLFNQENLNFVERNLNRFNKTSSKSLETSDVESGLQVIEENNNIVDNEKVSIVKIDSVDNNMVNETDIETEHLIASNPVQKSVLTPTYEYIINAASRLESEGALHCSSTNIAEIGSSRSKNSKINDADSHDTGTTDSLTVTESGRANFCKKVSEITCELEDY